MRYCVFLLAPVVLIAQSSPADQTLTETLIKEVQQLRLAIERSSLLNARTQVIVTDVQVHEAAVARLTQQYYELRTGYEVLSARRNQLTEKVQAVEAKIPTASAGYYDKEINQAKAELADAVDAEQKSSSRTSEVASQLKAEQSALADARGRLDELRTQAGCGHPATAKAQSGITPAASIADRRPISASRGSARLVASLD